MAAISQKLAKLSTIHESVAELVSGRTIRCRSCGAVAHPSPDQFADFLRNGWPQCCNETVELVSNQG